jgi:hypothetical protein
VIEQLKEWAWVPQFISVAALPLLVSYLRGIFAAKATVEKMVEAQAQMLTRLALAEQSIADAPTQRDFAGLRTDFSSLHGDLRTLTAELRGFKELFERAEGTLSRMHTAMMKE